MSVVCFVHHTCHQRKRLGVVGELVFRQPITEVDNCNIADVLFISQIYNVEPELKYNKEQMLRQYSSSPNNAKPNVGRSAFSSKQFFVQRNQATQS